MNRLQQRRSSLQTRALGLWLLLGGLAACQESAETVDADHDGISAEEGDCDDTKSTVYPGAVEVCNGVDENCNGTVDEGLPLIPFYADQDEDTFGDASQVTYFCGTPDGLSSALVDRAGDCDDTNPLIHPGVVETADGVDNDCNGITDDTASGVWYQDADRDGFGTPDSTAPEARDGYIQSRGDCDDTDPAIHPGANDPSSDGVDQDCGGTSGPEPHVGLSPESATSLQAALQAAQPYATVWVGPGDYKESNVSFFGKPVTLASTHFAVKTSVDGDTIGTVFNFDSGEQSYSILDGFRVSGAPATSNGAIYINLSSPTIRNTRLTQNGITAINIHSGNPLLFNLYFQSNTGIDGGAIAAYQSQVTLTSSNFLRNRAGTAGGAIYALESTLSIENSVFEGNLASSGGAIASSASILELNRLTFSHNLSTNRGGALYIDQSTFNLTDSRLEKNGAFYDGGAIFASGSQIEMLRDELYENYGYYAGGIELWNSTAHLSNLQLLGNLGVLNGGGLRILCSDVSLTQSTLVGNISTRDGGGIYYFQCKDLGQLTIDSSILFDNAASALFTGREDKAVMNVEVTHSLVYNSQSEAIPEAPVNEAVLSEGNLAEDPQFMNFTPDRNPYNDDLHLQPDSPAWSLSGNQGDNSSVVRVELGAFGGDAGDSSYYLDADSDGLYDGWERIQGLDPATSDGSADPDADGISNQAEQSYGSHPLKDDSDGDGEADGAEVNGGGDPTDWFLRIGGKPGVGRVPADYPTVQSAVDAVRSTGLIEIQPGTFSETLDVSLKALTLRGAGSDATTLEGPQEGGVIVSVGANLSLEDLSVTGGFFSKDSEEEFANGAGLCVSGGSAFLNRVKIHDNVSAEGGGIALWRAVGTLYNSSIVQNESLGNGGGVISYSSTLVTDGGEVAENLSNASGGGIYADQSEVTLLRYAVRANSAMYGAGMAGEDSTLGGFAVTCTDNTASVSGGGIVTSYGTATFTELRLNGNTAAQRGGGGVFYGSTVTLADAIVSGNEASQGGGIHSDATLLTLTNVGVRDNQGEDVGGLYLSNQTIHFSNVSVQSNLGNGTAQGMALSIVSGDISALELTGNTGDAPSAFKLWSSSPRLQGLVVAANSGLGVLLDGNSAPAMLNSIVAYNPDGNLLVGEEQSVVTIPISYSDFYNPPGLPNIDATTSSNTNRQVEPKFLLYDSNNIPINFHLAKGSPLIDTGAAGVLDPDGSKGDLGLYGGLLGDAWDRDLDNIPDYFWPGELGDAPQGFDTGDFDEDDTKASRP